MNYLVVLRGAPGSGKSTWIKQNNFEDYTLCPDTLRLLYSAPVETPEGFRIAREKDLDDKVWKTLFDMLDTRMSRGGLTVIDAMCRNIKDIRNYARYCKKYNYTLILVDFSTVSLDTCLRRNSNRKDIRRVPENDLRKAYSQLKAQNISNLNLPVNYYLLDYTTDICQQISEIKV